MTDTVPDREYPYAAKAPLLMLLIFWGGALALLYWALTDHGPIRGRDGRVTVGEDAAAVVRWTAVGLCGLFAVVVSRAVWIDWTRSPRIALTPDGVYLPRTEWGWFPYDEFVPYRDVTDLRETVVHRLGSKYPVVTVLQLHYSGRRYRICRDAVGDGAFEELRGLLRGRVAAARG